MYLLGCTNTTSLHSRRMCTTSPLDRISERGEGLPGGPHQEADSPQEVDSAPKEADPPGHVTSDVCWEEVDPPVNRMTRACENITFPQLRLRAIIILCGAIVQ